MQKEERGLGSSKKKDEEKRRRATVRPGERKGLSLERLEALNVDMPTPPLEKSAGGVFDFERASNQKISLSNQKGWSDVAICNSMKPF